VGCAATNNEPKIYRTANLRQIKMIDEIEGQKRVEIIKKNIFF
jgi:hypothetical protein